MSDATMSNYNAYQEDVHRITVPGSYYEPMYPNPNVRATSSQQQKPPEFKDRIGKKEFSSKISMFLSALILFLGLYCYPIHFLNLCFLNSHNGAARVFSGCSLCLIFFSCAMLVLAFVLPLIAAAGALGGVFGPKR